MPDAPPKRLLIAGGGPAALEGALAVQRVAGGRVRVTLLADGDTFAYRPLAVAELLEDAGVRLWTGAYAEAVEDGRLWLSSEGGLPVDLAVALPRFAGCAIEGLPTDAQGFVPVDSLGRVEGLEDVYAAGDMTSRALKQGGLATQQADAAASAIGAWAGAPVTPQPYRPVLRGMLLTGERPRYLRHAGEESPAADDAPWWPPHKIAGRELAPYLTAHPELLVEPVEVAS